jgi:hypothetical protein
MKATREQMEEALAAVNINANSNGRTSSLR